jgi:hypothetical protein
MADLICLQQNSAIGKRMSDILSAQNDVPTFLQEETDKKPASPVEPLRSPTSAINPSAQPNTASFESSPSVNVKRHSRSLDLPVSELKESEWSGIHHHRSNSDTSKDVPKESSYIEQPDGPGLVPESLAAALPPSPSPTSNSSLFSLAMGRRQPFGDWKRSARGASNAVIEVRLKLAKEGLSRDANVILSGMFFSECSNLQQRLVVPSQLANLNFRFHAHPLNQHL